MTEKRGIDLISVWNAAIPLSRAALHFAPESLRQKWEALSNLSAVDAAMDRVENGTRKHSDWMEYLAEAAAGAQTVLQPRAKAMREAEGLLLEQLKARRLFGFGFEPPRRIQSIPVHISPRYWNYRVSWDRSKLSAQSLEFIEIRVISEEMAAPILRRAKEETKELPEPPPPMIGRPTIQPDVEAAFTALQASGKIDTTKPAKSHFQMVRQWISQNASFDASRLSDEGIRAHFAPLFKRLKENRKQ